jgi:hypothetical protein
MNRLVSRVLVAATTVAGTGAFVLLAAQPPQQKPPDPQRPVFRAGAVDRREARLLDRAGKPLPIPLTLTETQTPGRPALAVDLTPAPLAVSDFVIELVAGAGDKTDRKLLAFRVGGGR